MLPLLNHLPNAYFFSTLREKILEIDKELKSMGSNMSICIAMMAVFEQLGPYDRFIAITKPFGAMQLMNQAPGFIPEYRSVG